MWHAEMIIKTRSDLPDDLAARFAERIPGTHDHASVLRDTIHRDSAFLTDCIVCSFRDQHVVFFITKSDARTLTVHIERLDKKAPVRELKASVREVIRRVESFVRHHKNRVKGIDGELFAVGNKELNCVRRSFLVRLGNAFKSNLLSKAYVPAATVVASLVLGTRLEQSLFNALVALVALAIWVLIEALTADSYGFTEV